MWIWLFRPSIVLKKSRSRFSTATQGHSKLSRWFKITSRTTRFPAQLDGVLNKNYFCPTRAGCGRTPRVTAGTGSDGAVAIYPQDLLGARLSQAAAAGYSTVICPPPLFFFYYEGK